MGKFRLLNLQCAEALCKVHPHFLHNSRIATSATIVDLCRHGVRRIARAPRNKQKTDRGRQHRMSIQFPWRRARRPSDIREGFCKRPPARHPNHMPRHGVLKSVHCISDPIPEEREQIHRDERSLLGGRHFRYAGFTCAILSVRTGKVIAGPRNES